MLYKITYKLAALIIRFILFINGGVKIIGKDNIPMEGGVLVTANHISYIDPPLLGAIMPRIATFMARKGLFEMPFIRFLIKGSAIPVNRERPSPSTIKEIIKRLRSGKLIVMFPEGRRSDTGKLLEAKRGVGMIVSHSRVPVVPTLIVGSDKVLPVNAKWLKRAKILVVFGKPLYYTPEEGKKDPRNHGVHEEISNSIMSAIRELSNKYADNRS
jgi:1-acyl-sn-glycerol-3-phosphate acyltransferase